MDKPFGVNCKSNTSEAIYFTRMALFKCQKKGSRMQKIMKQKDVALKSVPPNIKKKDFQYPSLSG